MMDAPQPLTVVAGDMQPWSDTTDRRPAAGGPALLAMLRATLPRGERAIIAGPHSADVVALVAERYRQVTVLLRSRSDAQELAEATAPNVTVVAGSLDGYAHSAPEPADLLLAADGLDRVTSTDSPDLSWPQRLALLAGLGGAGAQWALRLDNELSATTILDARVAKMRDGDDEWWPIHSDPQRPVGSAAFVSVLESSLTAPPEAVWTMFGGAAHEVLLAADPAGAVRVDDRIFEDLRHATRAGGTPLLATPDSTLLNAARAGLLPAFADAYLATSFAGLAAAYAGSAQGVVVAEQVAGDRVFTADPHWQSSDGLLRSAADFTEPAGGAAPTATTVLNRYAEAEDVPSFRALAARLGALFTGASGAAAYTFDDVRVEGEQVRLTRPVLEWTNEVDSTGALTVAWSLYARQLLSEHRRHPWPPWLTGPTLCALWLQMSGQEVSPDDAAALARIEACGAQVEAVALARGVAALDLRTELADVEALNTALAEANGHIFGLERTIGFRDRQLRSRERIIHGLRGRVAKVDKIRATKAFGVAKEMNRLRRLSHQERLKEARRQAGKLLRRVRG